MAEGKLADPIGLPLDRVDGQLKVTGRATYAFEYATQGGAAYGVIVPAAVLLVCTPMLFRTSIIRFTSSIRGKFLNRVTP